MKISRDMNLYAGKDAMSIPHGARQEMQNRKSLYAGSLNDDIFANSIHQKKKEAQEKAMKVIENVWASERKIDEDLQCRQEHVDDLRQENKEAQAKINEINQIQEDLRELYGVTEDSQEQQDLEGLRQKRVIYCKGEGMSMPEFMDEVRREEGNVTEYQQRQLELDAEKEIYQEIIDNNKKTIKEENAIISGIKRERLKHAPMLKAQNQAEEILDAASKEIIGMAMEEAKNHIDEEQEKREEKAEELKEQKEEREAFIEKQKEKRKKQEALIEDMPIEEMLELSQTKNDIQQEVQNIVNEMKLVAEDIKGAMVDESL